MSNKFGEGYIEIKADNKAFLKGLSDTKTLFTGWAGELAAAAGIIGFGAMIKDITDFGDEMVKTSQKVGIGVEALQKLAYAAKLSDVDMGSLSTGLRFLSKNLADAGSGGSRALAALGLSGKQLAQSGLDNALMSIADKIKAMTDGYAKVAVMQEIFGKGAMTLIPLMNQGSAAIKEQSDELAAMGGVMSEKLARQSEEMNDNLTRLSFVGKSLAITIGNEMIPVLVEATGAMIGWWKANQEVISQDIRLFLQGAAVSGHALGETLSRLGPLAVGTFDLGSLAARSFWTGLNTIELAVFKIAEAFTYAWQQTLMLGKEVFTLMQKYIPQFWQDAGYIIKVSGSDFDAAIAKTKQWGDFFQKATRDSGDAASKLLWTSQSLTMSWNTGTTATQQYSKELEDLMNRLAATGKEGQKTAKMLMDAYGEMMAVQNAMGFGGGVDLATMAQGGWLTGGESLWGRQSGGGYLGPNAREFNFGGYGMQPGMIMTDAQREIINAGGGMDLANYMNTVMSSLIPGEGMVDLMVESWDEMIVKLEEEQQKLVDSFSFMGMNLSQMSDWMSGIISNFFADSAAQGFGQGIKKMIGALINTYADFVIKNGMVAMATGLFEVIMGSSPVWPRPDWVAHGGYAIAQGAVLLGIGGALKGGAAAIGGTFSGAGGGASFQTNAARPTAGTVQPVNYTVGSNGQPTAATGNTNINVYAYDSESLKDYVQKNKHTFADGVLAAGFENHPVRNGW